MATFIRDALAKVGMKVSLMPLDLNSLTTRVNQTRE
jgi:hypothetical protein